MSFPTKLVSWILMIAAVIASGLWLTGGKKVERSAAIQIEASPEDVFLFLTEADKHKSWRTGLDHVEQLVSNTDEDGSSKRVTTDRVITIDGQESRFKDEVIRFEPNELLTVRSSNSNQIVTSIYQLEPKESQTYFTYRVVKLNRGIKRFVAPLIGDNTQVQIDDDIRKLKLLVESEN